MTTSTKTPALTRVQLHTLIAISRGEVSQAAGLSALEFGWRIGGDFGRSVTNTVEALMRRGLVRESTELVDGRRPAVATPAGTEEISRAASRGR